MILGFEVANYVVAHLTGSVVKESCVDLQSDISYSPKEESIIKYFGGYVFGTAYRRIRRSQLTRNMLSVQCLSILLLLIKMIATMYSYGLLTKVFLIFSHMQNQCFVSVPLTLPEELTAKNDI